MIKHECDESSGCGRTFLLDPIENEWLKLSGDTFHCPYCGLRWNYTHGTRGDARKKLHELRRTVEHQSTRIENLLSDLAKARTTKYKYSNKEEIAKLKIRNTSQRLRIKKLKDTIAEMRASK